MRIYGSIQTRFWTHTDIHNLSDQAKLLAAYLLCSSHTNMLGCFRVPIGYIAEDLKWSFETVIEARDELLKVNFLTYDHENSWIMINNFLRYNTIDNPNQGKSVAKLFSEIPKNLIFISQLINKLLEYEKHLSDEFIKFLVTLLEPFRNQEQDKDKDKDKEQKQELYMSGKPDVVSQQNFSFEKNKHSQALLKSQALEVLDFLNQKTGRAYRPVDSNLKLIMARLKTGATVMDCRQIIAKKTREWKGNIKMAEYLRPETLFNGSKFEQYIGELVEPKENAANGNT